MSYAKFGTLLAANRYVEMLTAAGATPVNATQIEGGDTTSLNHLLWMCLELARNVFEDDMPVDKYSRWLGFIQGCLICKGLTTVETERNITRPWFTKGTVE